MQNNEKIKKEVKNRKKMKNWKNITLKNKNWKNNDYSKRTDYFWKVPYL
jgi:hypothetical protein